MPLKGHVFAKRSPPLSEVKMTIVSFARPPAFSAASTLPMFASSDSTIFR